MNQFALFGNVPHEASGGADDLLFIGDMDACERHAESHPDARRLDFHIASMIDLKVLKRSWWERIESGLVAVPDTYIFRWADQ